MMILTVIKNIFTWGKTLLESNNLFCMAGKTIYTECTILLCMHINKVIGSNGQINA